MGDDETPWRRTRETNTTDDGRGGLPLGGCLVVLLTLAGLVTGLLLGA